MPSTLSTWQGVPLVVENENPRDTQLSLLMETHQEREPMSSLLQEEPEPQLLPTRTALEDDFDLNLRHSQAIAPDRTTEDENWNDGDSVAPTIVDSEDFTVRAYTSNGYWDP